MWNAPRAYTLEDYLAAARRQAGWIAGPTLFGLVAAVVTAFLWPDRYVSEARLRVLPPQVPERLVPRPGTLSMPDRVTSITQTVLSRNTLRNIIQTFDLYREERAKGPIEDVIEAMRRDISIGAVHEGSVGRVPAFGIAFGYGNRHEAQRVVRDLANRLIDEGRRGQQRQASQTVAFLEAQAGEARAELEAVEAKTASVRAGLHRAAGASTAVSQVETKLSGLRASETRVEQERILLDTELDLLENQRTRERSRPPTAPVPRETRGTASPAEVEAARIRAQIDLLLTRYTDRHPDLPPLRLRLSALERSLSAATRPAAATPTVEAPPVSTVNLDQQIVRLRAKIRAKEAESRAIARELAEASGRLAGIQEVARAEPAATREDSVVSREQDNALRRYEDVRRRLAQAREAEAVDALMQGETLELLDAPTLPDTPSSPVRPAIIGAGVMLGVILGCALAAIRESRDTRLETAKDITASSGLEVLVTVPLLEDPRAVRRRHRIAVVAWSSAVMLGVAMMSAAVLYYRSTRI